MIIAHRLIARNIARGAAALLCGTVLGWQPVANAEQVEAEVPAPLAEEIPVQGESVVDHGMFHMDSWHGLHDEECCKSLGSERLLIAPFEIDVARPVTQFRIRYDGASGYNRPDRAEYFWARQTGRGPTAVNNNVDYQDLRFYYEAASDFISIFTDLPIRGVDPSTSPDTTGFGDMNAGIKSRLFAGERWEMTTIFRTYIPTGSARKGLGTGHVSLEPGLLGNYRLTCKTYLHGDIRFWIPIGGTPEFQGNILRYGVGVSHLLWESCNKPIAVIPTLEFVTWSVLDGQETLPTGVVVGVDGETILNVQPGIRTSLGKHFEVGVSGAFSLTGDRWYDTLGRLDVRWIF